ncbi:macro domain-containing protein [Hahella aquimaris]|uniref:macro domain-containing protein n=1 Tax=Hahella sp. HNIBRBA332 TaxID=3015983 RepID=UPI00273B327A|nr:macro domain-containing protein [Hahella sp. HNIBRBA332]WLQ17367.1 macro domain-containing protein [Hahella sp. HNIBRBA332]
MKTVEGDLLALAQAGYFDVIIHGCNCQCQMGRGIALTIKNTFPDAYKADLKTEKGARDKLGTYSCAEITSSDTSFTIVNAYTQFHWRGAGDLADYEAIRSVMRKIKTDFSGKRIGYPLIGAGLAGGNWERIAAIINEELQGEDHTLVKWNGASA